MFRGVGANTNIPRYASIGKLDGHSKRDSVNVCLGVWEVLHGVLSIFKRTFDLPRAASCAKTITDVTLRVPDSTIVYEILVPDWLITSHVISLRGAKEKPLRQNSE